MTRSKLLLIGIDAADARLVRRWASEGHLPTLAALLASGATAPITTPPAVLEGGIWPTFLTSSSPASHAMFAHLKLRHGTYDMEVGMYADRLPVAPFWAHLSRAGKRVAVIDAPFARPVDRLNGIQVTNWGAHDPWSWPRSSWPPRFVDELVQRFGDHPVAICDAQHRTLADYEDLRDRLIAGVRKKGEVLKYCLGLEDWDFFFGTFSESHCAGHQFWHLIDPAHPQHDPRAGAALRGALRDVYRAIDDGIAALLQDARAGTHVLVMLSHGMGPYYAGSHLLDAVLQRLGITDGVASPHARLESRDGAPRFGAPRTSGAYAPGQALWALRRLLPTRLRLALKARLYDQVAAFRAWLRCPDRNPWVRSRAFAVPTNNMTGAIRVNLKGRDPAGLVEPGGEYETLCEELREAFLALENAETGRPAVQWVARASELYRGARLDELPDVFVEWDHGTPITTLRSPQIGTVSAVFRHDRTGDHRQDGLLIARGPAFRSGELEDDVRTEDVAPTVLDFFGVPPPAEYEGRSALAALTASREDALGGVRTRHWSGKP